MFYDITQELFSCNVYPGDTPPSVSQALRISNGAVCNLTDINICLHNGTHIDAPFHFLNNGRTVAELDLTKCMGKASVREFSGEISAENAKLLLSGCSKRLLIKGDSSLTPEAANIMAESGILLIGVEQQSVSDSGMTAEVHRILLSAEIVILEGLVLNKVPCKDYFLSALPLKIDGADGSPCRAILIETDVT